VVSPVSSTNKTDRHDITEILLKVVLNTISQAKPNLFINDGYKLFNTYIYIMYINKGYDLATIVHSLRQVYVSKNRQFTGTTNRSN